MLSVNVWKCQWSLFIFEFDSRNRPVPYHCDSFDIFLLLNMTRFVPDLCSNEPVIILINLTRHLLLGNCHKFNKSELYPVIIIHASRVNILILLFDMNFSAIFINVH